MCVGGERERIIPGMKSIIELVTIDLRLDSVFCCTVTNRRTSMELIEMCMQRLKWQGNGTVNRIILCICT